MFEFSFKALGRGCILNKWQIIEVMVHTFLCINVSQGSARRKKKVVHRTATADDKKLQFSLKKLGVNNISGIEEVVYTYNGVPKCVFCYWFANVVKFVFATG